MSRARTEGPRVDPDPEVAAVDRTDAHEPLEGSLGSADDSLLDSVLLSSVLIDDSESDLFVGLDRPRVVARPAAPPPPPLTSGAEENDRTAAYDPPPELFAGVPDPEVAPLPVPAIVALPVPPAVAPAARVDRPAPAPAAARPGRALRRESPPPPASRPPRPSRRGPALAPLAEIPMPEEEDDEPSVVVTRGAAREEDLTGIYEPRGAELPRGRLVVVSGENAGKMYYLNRQRVSVGRATENDVVLFDIAVSRRHVRIDRHERGFRLVDLQSGNGTQVNGRRVAEAELYDGDRVEVGNIVLDFTTVGRPRTRDDEPNRVTDPGMRTPPIATTGRRPVPVAWLLLWTVTTFTAVLLALFVTRLMTGDKAEPDAAVRNKARTYIERAESAMRAKEWDRAEEELQVAQALDEGLQFQFAERLEKIGREKANLRRLEEARRALDRGAQDEVKAIVAGIGAESAYHADAQALLATARRRAADERAREAQALLTAGRADEARQLAQGVVESDAAHPGGKAVLAALQASAREAAPPEEIVKRVAAPEQQADRKARGDLADGLRLYREQRFDDAQVAFERATRRGGSARIAEDARARARWVKAFAEEWSDADRAIRARRSAEATDSLARAARIDKRLGGLHRDRIDQLLADQHYLQAIQAFSRQAYAEAAQQNTRVLTLAPGHPLGRKLSEKMDRTAADLVQRARSLRESDPEQCRRLARAAVALTSDKDQTHRAARQILQSLGE